MSSENLRLLVPIRVGMIPEMRAIENTEGPCPHTRGDDPSIRVAIPPDSALSPYAWG